MNIVSWNVNGIRAAAKKGLLEYLDETKADMVCLQETKAHPEQLSDELIAPSGFVSHWSSAEKKGYSGVVTYTKKSPNSVENLQNPAFDAEGRGVVLHFDTFSLINCYFPNSQAKGVRLAYKLSFCHHLLALCNSIIEKGRNIILCGDYNIAHKPIDIARPKDNEKNPGYLPEERAWLDSFVEAGYVDTFRLFHSEPHRYTWWSPRGTARENNIGWRLDYFFVNASYARSVSVADIHDTVPGSDHCPTSLVVRS